MQLYADVAALAGALHTNSEAVALVVGHSNTVPQLLASLGVGAKIEIGDKEYDNLFVVVPKASGPPVLLRLRY